MRTFKFRRLQWLAMGLLLALLCACVTSSHHFEFDARWDSPQEQVLDYRYGDSKIGGTYLSESLKREGKFHSYSGVYGPIPKPDYLYVKWRIKSTGEVYGDTVDLRNRLPFNMAEQRVRFVVKGPQLHVYLISPEILQPNPCEPRAQQSRIGQPDHPDRKIQAMYCHYRITKIYPDQKDKTSKST